MNTKQFYNTFVQGTAQKNKDTNLYMYDNRLTLDTQMQIKY